MFKVQSNTRLVLLIGCRLTTSNLIIVSAFELNLKLHHHKFTLR